MRCPHCGGELPTRLDRDEVIALRRDGLSQQAIADKLGVSSGTVCRALRGTGLERIGLRPGPVASGRDDNMTP